MPRHVRPNRSRFTPDARYNSHMPPDRPAPRDAADRYLHRLAGWRSRKASYSDLHFIRDQFRREIERPHRQLGDLVDLWQSLMPADLLERTKLRSFQRNTLHVSVPDSPTRYHLDRALRGGLEAKLRAAFKGNLRAIKVRVEPMADPRSRPDEA